MSKRTFQAICCLTVISCLVGCGSSGTRQGGGAKARSVVVSPLSVQVSDAKSLLSVNSIVIEKPVFREGVRSSTSEDALLTVLREVAGETLSMKVVDSSRGAKVGGDSVLKTEIVTMEDLKGSTVGGTPARVAFRMWIYPSSGPQRPIWQANYAFQQEAITDNLLRIGDRLGREGSGTGWITAQEVFRRGVQQSLMDFNSRRDSQFQSKEANR